MRRSVGVLLAAAAIMSVVLGGTAAAASTKPAAEPATCTGTVQVTSFVFDPSTVSPGGRSTATLTVKNCTSTAVSVSGTWYGRFTAPGGTGIPTGCPAIDPIAQQSTIAPNGTATQTLSYLAFAQCAASELDAFVNLSVGGTTVGLFTAPLTIQRNTTPNCRVRDAMNVWPGGFVANLTIRDTGTTAIDGWTLVFTLPAGQTITSTGWGASSIRQTGQVVTIVNTPWNAVINPGASVSVGFQGTWTAGSGAPAAFTLNGAPCAAG